MKALRVNSPLVAVAISGVNAARKSSVVTNMANSDNSMDSTSAAG